MNSNAAEAARTDPDLGTRLAAVEARICAAAEAAGRDRGAITLVAVSKTRSAAEVEAAIAAGCTELGENYLQEALAKQSEVKATACWHFIGAIQSNKTRAVAEHFDWVHTVDRDKIARRLSDQRSAQRPPLDVCLEVNVDGEASKAGVLPDAVTGLALAVAALPRLRLRGLMAIPQAPADGADEAARRAPFRRLAVLQREVRDALAAAGHATGAFDVLSMGMSADLEDAIAEGSTHVRVGTALFGPRPPKAADA